MRFELITIVWGDHHVDLFLELTLPNILSAENIPALARDHEVVYRFFTTPDSAERIKASPAHALLARYCTVEINTPLGERKPDVSWHVHWFHRSAAEAKVNRAVVVFVPPDTLWTDGAFALMGTLMQGGARGIANPFVLVNSETCIPDAQARFTDAGKGTITVPRREMWPLVRRHVHPLHALAIPGGPHGRPAFELHWPVNSAAMMSVYAVRELVCFDPARCPMTFLWYPGGSSDQEGIHFITESDEFLMLSVDPLSKYFANYIIDHSCDALDLARTTRHPLNDTGFTRFFASRPVQILGPEDGGGALAHSRRRAIAQGRRVMVARTAMMLHDVLRTEGANHMAGLLAIALIEGGLARPFREDTPVTVIIPRDAAFDASAKAASFALGAAGHERALVDFLLDHLMEGRLDGSRPSTSRGGLSVSAFDGGIRIGDRPLPSKRMEIEGVVIHLVDGLVSPRITNAPPATAVGKGENRLVSGLKSLFGRR